ncbi:MAG: radical SAM protein [Theionarchaea archaeon]|nr:radical SAM protein [Theionarchaea archaeon]
MRNGEYLLKYRKAISKVNDDPHKKRNLFHLQWHITDICNLRCKHCYSDGNSIRDLSLAQLKEIFNKYVKTISKWNMRGEISLTGGEPMLRQDFFHLLDYIHDRWKRTPCFSVSLMSNGTLITEEYAAQLGSYLPMLSSVQISMDGTSKEVHEEMRGEGVFERTKESFSLLQKQGFGTALHYVVHKQNYHDAFNILELGEELKVNRVTLSRLVPEGRGKRLTMLTPSELKKLWSYLSLRCLDSYSKGVILARSRCDLWHLVDIPSALYSLRWGVLEKRYPSYLQIGQRCPVGINGLVVDTDGCVLPCKRLPIPLGNITQDTFFNIWYSSRLLWKFRYRERYMKGKCRDCPFLAEEELRHLCAGGSPCISLADCGDCFLPDSQCWFNPYSEEEIDEVRKWKRQLLDHERTFSS